MELQFGPTRRRLPDFLILGAAKSGTTSLYFYLRQHPQIFMPAGQKEPGFFSFLGGIPSRGSGGERASNSWNSVITDMDTYSGLFSDAGEGQLIGEATADYLYTWRSTIANIAKVYGENRHRLKFIVVLRNPVDRLWSHYMMFRRDSYERLGFEEAVSQATIHRRLQEGDHPAYDYIGYGLYHDPLEGIISEYGRDRVKVFLFEELEQAPARVCRETFAFLGVDSSFIPDTSVRYNASGQLRFALLHEWLFIRQHAVKDMARKLLPYDFLQSLKYRLIGLNRKRVDMPPSKRREMADRYHDDIVAVGRLLGRDLSHWLK